MRLNNIKKSLSLLRIKLNNYIHYMQYDRLPTLSSRPKAVLMATPSYGNLGDQLIALGETELLSAHFSSNNILEITENDIRYHSNKVKCYIARDAVIYIQGGGNLGDIYTDQEDIRLKILEMFPDNTIIIMPQTAYFSNESAVDKCLDKYRDRVTICARERKTYDLLRSKGISTFLCPDIALSLTEYCERNIPAHNRHGIGVCMRNDSESLHDIESQLIHYLDSNAVDYESFSTVVREYISRSARADRLNVILDYISSKELIITDRLHAMIMAYLTGTPCIAFDNQNNKVRGSFEWINNAENICLADSMDECITLIDKLRGKKNCEEFRYNDKFTKILMDSPSL